jgi:hypothetical protein
MTNPWKVSSFALVAMLVAVLGRDAGIDRAAADVQPKMQQALGQLRDAAYALENAATDKGGHRAKALKLTREAISEVERGIKFDNKH